MDPIAWQADVDDWPGAVGEIEIEPRRTGLLMVDMQAYSALALQVVEPNRRLLEFFRRHGLPVVYLRVGSFLPDARDQHPKRREAWLRGADDAEPPRHYPGSAGYGVCAELAPLTDELVIDKNSTGAFNSSALDHYLRALGLENLVVTGVSTNHCVESTARDAADRGYNVILVSDATFTSDPQAQEATLYTFARAFGAVKTTDQVMAELGALLAGEAARVPARGSRSSTS